MLECGSGQIVAISAAPSARNTPCRARVTL
jgi:hypothetical protein